MLLRGDQITLAWALAMAAMSLALRPTPWMIAVSAVSRAREPEMHENSFSAARLTPSLTCGAKAAPPAKAELAAMGLGYAHPLVSSVPLLSPSGKVSKYTVGPVRPSTIVASG